MPGGGKTWIAALLGLLAAAALLAVLLATSGDGGPSRHEEVDGAYLRIAHRTRELTFTIDRATEAPSGPAILAGQFRGFRDEVGYTAAFLLTLGGLGPVADRGFVLQHSLGIYEFLLRAVVRRARGGERPS